MQAQIHPSSHRTQFLPYLALAFGIVAIGLSPLFVKWANAPGAVSGFYRMIIAAAVMALPFSADAKRRAPLSRQHVWMAVLAGLFFGGELALWNTAVITGSVANSTLFANTSPLWVGIGALILFKEKLRPLFWGGMFLAMIGVIVILGNDFLSHPTLSTSDALALGAGVSYGMFFLAAERARDRLSAIGSLWISVAASAIVLLTLSIILRQPLWGYSNETFANIIATALVSQVAGWFAVNYALGHLPASHVSSTMLAQPVFSALIAIPFLGQSLALTQILGGLLVLVGIFIVHRSRVRIAAP